MADVHKQAEDRVRDHPDATLKEAFIAGYWQECDNWCSQNR